MAHQKILVIGGAASGKSAFAEKLINDSGLEPVYIATSRVLDAEMKSKVARHVTQRGDGWHTIETPLEPSVALKQCEESQAVVIDCATMWLTNHLMDGSDMEAAEARFREGLKECAALTVLVSNELGHGVVPMDSMSRDFRQAHGEMNQRLAQDADVVIYMIAGLPQILKGKLLKKKSKGKGRRTKTIETAVFGPARSNACQRDDWMDRPSC